MHFTAVRWVLAIGFGLASASPLLAQFGIARLSHADGAVTRLHGSAPAATTVDVSLMDGDQIETAVGRAEITFRDGTIVHLDTHTRVILYTNDRIHVHAGRLFLRTSGLKSYLAATSAGNLRVLAASVSEVTVMADNHEVLLRVVSGSARVECPWGGEAIAVYHSALLSGPSCRPFVSKWIPPQSDDFEHWALARTVMATSTAMRGTEGTYYGPYYGRWYYYPVYVNPAYWTPYYVSRYDAAPTHVNPQYVTPSYATPYTTYHPYAHPAYRAGAAAPRSSRHTPRETTFVPPIPSAPRPQPLAIPSSPPVSGGGAGAVVRPPS